MKLFGVEHRPWSPELRWLAFLTGAVLVLVMLINQYLAIPEAPQIITSYEIADDPEVAEAIHREWERQAGIWPRVSLWVDFAFIGLYAVFLVKLANHFLYDRPGVREQKAGRVAKVLLVVGAAGDATENACLLLAIQQPESGILAACYRHRHTGQVYGAAGWRSSSTGGSCRPAPPASPRRPASLTLEQHIRNPVATQLAALLKLRQRPL